MWKVVRVIINTMLVFILSLAVVIYQRNEIISLGGEKAALDIFITIVIFGIILALDVFNGAECIYLLYTIKNTDHLTGIPNSQWLNATGGRLDHFGQLRGKYTIIFTNIKDCKYINEKIGARNGDKVLMEYGKTINNFMKKKGFAGRMGGDNFLMLVKNEYVQETLNMLKNVYVDVENKTGKTIRLHVESRAGICESSEHLSYREMINCCSAALATAKKRGVEDYVVYDQQMTEKLIKDRKVLEKFKNALMKGEFVPYYQPKVNLNTGKLCGAEALARWFEKDMMIPPKDFISALESDGSIMELDYYIFEQVCKQQKKWLDAGLEPVCVSVNFSKIHLENDKFAEQLIVIKNKYELDGKYLEVELTESSGCEDYNLLESFATKIKSAGIKISIDDFGTGYSSLSMLQKFIADAVKLDKSFLDSAFSEKAGQKHKQFVTDIIRMIKYQGEETVCEGVETEEQLEFLRNANCDIIQGFYFDKPLPKDEFEKRVINKTYF